MALKALVLLFSLFRAHRNLVQGFETKKEEVASMIAGIDKDKNGTIDFEVRIMRKSLMSSCACHKAA